MVGSRLRLPNSWILFVPAADEENRVAIPAAGAIDRLVAVLGSTSPGVQEHAAYALRHLLGPTSVFALVENALRHQMLPMYVIPACADDNMARIAAAGAITPLIRLLQHSWIERSATSSPTMVTGAHISGVCAFAVLDFFTFRHMRRGEYYTTTDNRRWSSRRHCKHAKVSLQSGSAC